MPNAYIVAWAISPVLPGLNELKALGLLHGQLIEPLLYLILRIVLRVVITNNDMVIIKLQPQEAFYTLKRILPTIPIENNDINHVDLFKLTCMFCHDGA